MDGLPAEVYSAAAVRAMDQHAVVLETRKVKIRSRFAGTVDFVPANPLSAPELSERMADMAAEEAVAEAARHLARWRRAAAAGSTRVRLLLMLVP